VRRRQDFDIARKRVSHERLQSKRFRSAVSWYVRREGKAPHLEADKCIGCYACTVACKLEHSLPPYPVCPPQGNPKGPELIRVLQIGPQVSDGEVNQCFRLIVCMHCVNAPCIAACPSSAIYKDVDTGLTLVDGDQCTGCEHCLSACPYGAPQFYDGRLHLCDLCIHRLGEGRPEGRNAACEAACPARAIHVGPIGEVSWPPR
jgi:Fe-S-cluster-containing dehydrogenase component